MEFPRWLGLSLVYGVTVAAAVPPKADGQDDATAKKYEQLVDRAIAFLATKDQAADGSFNAAAGPAVTALVTTAVLRHGRSPDDPLVAKALKYVERFVRDDGGIYGDGSNNKNYETCIALVCFQEANRNGKYDARIKKADSFIKTYQWGSAGDTGPDDIKYGGAGYGRTGDRPDLSNTSFLIDALKASGNSADSEAMQRALIFISRCQNLESPHNTTPFSAKIDDGGFYYTPAAGGSSQAGIDDATGGLRSYGSMTYAGLKSMIYAGLKPDDERVKAAVKWLKKNYSVERNPGMPDADQGLFYYYQTFAKALAALGEDKFVDEKGAAHDWRKDLIDALSRRQRADGSWVNTNQRWLEGDSSLSTAYALLALSYCKK
jgi:squalene-hopene/tetraprenyl-beta-curcumene cyclase